MVFSFFQEGQFFSNKIGLVSIISRLQYGNLERCKNTQVPGNAHNYQWSDGVPNDFLFETPPQQKVTRIGKIYRKRSIDELPQLLNVLRGDMSLIGPRPEIPEITQLYSRYQAMRLKVRPGMTGYAQINGRSVINHGMKIEYDHYYIENQSIGLDVRDIY